MEKKLPILVLSALLHDIGKFAQRAGRPYSKALENEYLTFYKGKPGHWHVLYTDYFIENDLPLPPSLESHRSRIARIASAHHRPDESRLSEMCVMIADRLSSGSDRIPDEDQDSIDFRKSRLISVFDEIELLRHTFEPPGRAFHKLVPLTTGSNECFPIMGMSEGSVEDYPILFDAFLSDVRKLEPANEVCFYLEGLISLLEKYTWCIPSSSYRTLSDVSLFDHSIMTATIAQSLFLYHANESGTPRMNDDSSKFLMLEADLSGIQKYIFHISRDSGKGVSKIFRARSFYLQAVMKSILLDILRRLNLFSVCRLVDSGGKFILILPNLPDVLKTLNAINEEVQDWFYFKFKGQLTCNFSEPIQLTQKDFFMANFQPRIDELHESLEISKFRKLNHVIRKFGPVIEGGYDEHENGNCAICGANAVDETSSRRYAQKGGFGPDVVIPVCADCFYQMDVIGTQLPKSRFIIYEAHADEMGLFNRIGLKLAEHEPKISDGVIHIESLVDSVNFRRVRLAGYLPKITRQELTDKNWFDLFMKESMEISIEANQPKTFGMIAHKSKKMRNGTLIGRSLLGFFKADVDNLGLIFSRGLKEKMSAARFSMLSRMLDLFFADYLVELAKTEYPDIYVVFAGGDDLFVVGPWNHVVRFAITLRKRFSEFCAHNPDITLSGGILAAKPRLPMRRAVEAAMENLEQAKQVCRADRVKDSVCFLEEVLAWDELEQLMRIGQKFDTAVEEKERTNFTTAFLFRLLQYHRMYRKFKQDKAIQFGRYLSLAHYDIGRNIYSEKRQNQEELKMLNQIFAVGISERPELEKLNIPLFYAINLNRNAD